jgi:hypothetical protein
MGIRARTEEAKLRKSSADYSGVSLYHRGSLLFFRGSWESGANTV